MDLPSYTDPNGIVQYLLLGIILLAILFGILFYFGWL